MFLGLGEASYITDHTLAVDRGFDSTGFGLPAFSVLSAAQTAFLIGAYDWQWEFGLNYMTSYCVQA